MPFADLPGVRCYHEVVGAGPPLLTINGSGTDLRREPNPTRWPVALRYTVAAYDHRGLGRSTPTDPDHQPTMDDFAHDALALADHLGWERFRVVGISFGGMVAQHVAALAPDRIERLVLACTSPGGEGGSSYPLHELQALPADEWAAAMAGIIDTRAAADDGLRDLLVQFLSAGEGRGMEELGDGFARQLEARRHHDAWDRLPSITAPTLVAGGRHDGIAPPANSAALAGRIPDAQLQEFDGGHGFFMTDPAAWPAILDFLDAP